MILALFCFCHDERCSLLASKIGVDDSGRNDMDNIVALELLKWILGCILDKGLPGGELED